MGVALSLVPYTLIPARAPMLPTFFPSLLPPPNLAIASPFPSPFPSPFLGAHASHRCQQVDTSTEIIRTRAPSPATPSREELRPSCWPCHQRITNKFVLVMRNLSHILTPGHIGAARFMAMMNDSGKRSFESSGRNAADLDDSRRKSVGVLIIGGHK